MLSSVVAFFSWLKHLDWTLIFSAIAAAGAVAGVTIALWPKSPGPDIGQLKLHVSGTVGRFWFLCQFVAKNDGLGICAVDDVEILIDGCEVTPGGSVEFTSS